MSVSVSQFVWLQTIAKPQDCMLWREITWGVAEGQRKMVQEQARTFRRSITNFRANLRVSSRVSLKSRWGCRKQLLALTCFIVFWWHELSTCPVGWEYAVVPEAKRAGRVATCSHFLDIVWEEGAVGWQHAVVPFAKRAGRLATCVS